MRVCQFLDESSLLSLEGTCKELLRVGSLRQVWAARVEEAVGCALLAPGARLSLQRFYKKFLCLERASIRFHGELPTCACCALHSDSTLTQVAAGVFARGGIDTLTARYHFDGAFSTSMAQTYCSERGSDVCVVGVLGVRLGTLLPAGRAAPLRVWDAGAMQECLGAGAHL